jgi:NTP pyrophosphatase (non-canonical NTP hydrolase)
MCTSYVSDEERSSGTIDRAVSDVIAERVRQDQKWGEQNHAPFTYLTILMEEVGELAQAALQTKFGGKHGGLDHMREEAIQTAAVALAIVECLDRGKWHWDDDIPPYGPPK